MTHPSAAGPEPDDGAPGSTEETRPGSGCDITRAEYVARYLAEHDLPRAYMRAERRERGRILDRGEAALGYHRKALVRLFRRRWADGGARPPRRGRASVYSSASRSAVYTLWQVMDRPGERKLHGSLREWLDPLQRAGEIDLSRSVRDELRRMSPSTMGRIVRTMRPRRALTPRRSRPDTRVQAETPIRTWAHWENVQPGEMQVDTVFHAGAGGPGHLYTLTVISPYSGWWDAQAIDSLAQRHVIPALDRMRRRAPIRWTAIHSDNGSEFLNERAVAWSRTHDIVRSRGRPRTSGDQAWVENANRRFVRDLVGDVRYEGEQARTALTTLYEVAGTLENLYMANRRHVGTTRAGRTRRRLYDEARTPYRRLRESGCLDERAEQALRRQLDELNPAALMRAREALRDEVWELRGRGA